MSEDISKNMLTRVVVDFLQSGKGVPVHKLHASLKHDRRITKGLIDDGLLRCSKGHYYPGFKAIEEQAADTRNHGNRCLSVVLESLKLFYSEHGSAQATKVDLLELAKTIDRQVTPVDVLVGMHFASEFRFLVSSVGESDDGTVTTLSCRDEILDFVSVQLAWEAEISWTISSSPQNDLENKIETQSPSIAGRIPQFTVDFSFVQTQELRQIVERDLAELNRIRTITSNKSRLVLCGGLTEALLLDALSRNESAAKNAKAAHREKDRIKPLDEWDLAHLINTAIELGLITDAAHKFGHGLKDYRNLIHPGKEIRSNLQVNIQEADISEKVLEIVIRDLQQKPRKS